MTRLKIIGLVFSVIFSSIPGLYWQIIAPVLGIEVFGPEPLEPIQKMIIQGVPSTILAWIAVVIGYKVFFPLFVKESVRQTQKVVTNALLTSLLIIMGFALNWLFSDIISIAFDWTVLEYIDLLGGFVIMCIWGLVPGLIGGFLAALAGILWLPKAT